MKIFILRHEDRTQDATFFSPLTSTGLERSEVLVDVLKKHKINKIYSSPFIRTLQTVHPYSTKYGLKVNLEYSLSEIQHPLIIPEKSFQVRLPSYMANSFNYNEKYKSLLDPLNHVYPEDEVNVSKRVRKFLNTLYNNKISKNDNILIVTHQVVCNEILKICSKNMKGINISSAFNYPRGGLTQVFDRDEWLFEPINWERPTFE
jgi:broad specificity phosphatase PhoE